jgi:hypothetical protein
MLVRFCSGTEDLSIRGPVDGRSKL